MQQLEDDQVEQHNNIQINDQEAVGDSSDCSCNSCEREKEKAEAANEAAKVKKNSLAKARKKKQTEAETKAKLVESKANLDANIVE